MRTIDQEFEARARMKKIGGYPTQIIHVVTERTTELELLHRRLRKELVRKFAEAVTARTKSLDTLVTACNTEVKSIRD